MTVALFPEFEILPEFEVRLGHVRPDHQVYVRRRLVVVLLALGLMIGIAASARAILADRGGVPASTSAIRSANLDAASASPGAQVPAAQVPVAQVPGAEVPVAAAAVGTRYIVQPGDSLWSLAERFRGTVGMSSYVDALVDANGGSTVQPGQLIVLP